MYSAQQRFGRKLTLPSTIQIKRELILFSAAENQRRQAASEADSTFERLQEKLAVEQIERTNAETDDEGPPSPHRAMRTMRRAFARNNEVNDGSLNAKSYRVWLHTASGRFKVGQDIDAATPHAAAEVAYEGALHASGPMSAIRATVMHAGDTNKRLYAFYEGNR